jgi:hypothetical protein
MTSSDKGASKVPDWYHSFDARDWAKGFVDILKTKEPVAALDEEWMHSWFANAIMRGYDKRGEHFRESDCYQLFQEVLPWLKLTAPQELIARIEALLEYKPLPFAPVAPPEI